MSIAGVLIDLDGLLSDGNGPSGLVQKLASRGLIVGVMTNQRRSVGLARLKSAGVAVETLHCAEDPGCKSKPGGYLVAAFCITHGLRPHQVLVVGEEEIGVIEALNGRALGFHACWAGKPTKYGIHVPNSKDFLDYIDIFFEKDALWYARYDGEDCNGRAVTFRSLVDANGAGSLKLKNAILQTLKEHGDSTIAKSSLSKVLMMHMIASAYLEGLLSRDRFQVLWQIYPGHLPTSLPPPIIQAAIDSFKLFRSKPATNDTYGLRRHTAALQSHVARRGTDREKVKFENQISSVCLTAGTNVYGKRVLVLDDFCTEGHSLETARNIFYAAGAQTVDLFTFGKYGSRYEVVTPLQGVTIQPFGQKRYQDNEFNISNDHVNLNTTSLERFIASLQRLNGSGIGPNLFKRCPLLPS